MPPLWVRLWSFHISRFYCLTWGNLKKKKKGKEGIKRERQEEGKKRKKEREEGVKRKKILNKKALCWLLTGQASFSGIPGCSRLRGHWFSFSSFLISTCPASSPVSQFAAGPPALLCTQPRPSVHQLCCPRCVPIRGNSHTPFSLFAVLDARDSQRPLRPVQAPH